VDDAKIIRELEVRLGRPVGEWAGKCYMVAMALRDVLGKGELVTGFYDDEENVTDHGWLEMPDGSVVDPTRWTLEDRKPYIYRGPPDGCYDKDGIRWEAEQRALRAKFFPEVSLAEEWKELLSVK